MELGQYKGLEVEKVSAEVTDEDVMKELEKVQKQNARKIEVTDRAAQLGDVVNIDYLGSVDGVALMAARQKALIWNWALIPSSKALRIRLLATTSAKNLIST